MSNADLFRPYAGSSERVYTIRPVLREMPAATGVRAPQV